MRHCRQQLTPEHVTHFISTQLPPQATAYEQAQCSKLLAAMNSDMKDQLAIVAGNLPTDELCIRQIHSLRFHPPESAKSTISRIWYSANTSIQLLASRSVETDLGTLVIAQLDYQDYKAMRFHLSIHYFEI